MFAPLIVTGSAAPLIQHVAERTYAPPEQTVVHALHEFAGTLPIVVQPL